MVINNLVVPEAINGFKVYDSDGNTLIGISDEMDLAEFASKVATITGAGIAGSYDVPVLGYFDSIAQEIPFKILYGNVFSLANPMKQVGITLRGAIQVADRATGISQFVGLRYVVRGRCKSIKPGKIKQGDTMGSSVTLECMYVLYEIEGEKLIEIDKLNNIYRVGGVDLMEAVRKLC